jgi:hypothetical protein
MHSKNAVVSTPQSPSSRRQGNQPLTTDTVGTLFGTTIRARWFPITTSWPNVLTPVSKSSSLAGCDDVGVPVRPPAQTDVSAAGEEVGGPAGIVRKNVRIKAPKDLLRR